MTISKDKIEAIIAEKIVPFVELDRGTVEIAQFDGNHGNLQVRFGGSYRGSPCRDIVFRLVVEPVLREAFAELETVEWVD